MVAYFQLQPAEAELQDWQSNIGKPPEKRSTNLKKLPLKPGKPFATETIR